MILQEDGPIIADEYGAIIKSVFFLTTKHTNYTKILKTISLLVFVSFVYFVVEFQISVI